MMTNKNEIHILSKYRLPLKLMNLYNPGGLSIPFIKYNVPNLIIFVACGLPLTYELIMYLILLIENDGRYSSRLGFS